MKYICEVKHTFENLFLLFETDNSGLKAKTYLLINNDSEKV